MLDPQFLTIEEVLEAQRRNIDRYGGLHGLRDRGLLESALAMPQAGFGGEYAHGTIFEMAAAYLFHLVKNHPFLDGNKRIGLAAATAFLHLNGHALKADNKAVVALVLKLASGDVDKATLAKYLKEHSVTLAPD